ncbi:MAG: hypothetical protein JXB33_08685 [Clostridia bacterium]|nr:hypothetical protein [Clostridia bacterium]
MKEDRDLEKIFRLDETRRLMFPGELFEEEINTVRDVGRWNKLSHPAIMKTMDWEAWGPYGFMGLHRDEAEENWKMWYTCAGVDGHPGKYAFGMMHSEDGLNWTKHDKPINLFSDIQPGSVVIRPGLGLDEHRIFLMQYARKSGSLPGRAILAKSKDGIDFVPVTDSWDTSWFKGPSDVISLMWDEGSDIFRAYFKQWRICGTTAEGNKIDYLFSSIDSFSHDEGRHIYMISGHAMWPIDAYVGLEMLYSEDGDMKFEEPDKYPLGKDLFMHRVVASASSPDFIEWQYHGPALMPAPGRIADQFYGMSAIKYENQYIGFPLMYNGLTGLMETGLAYSYNGTEYFLLTEKPLISLGAPGSWEGGMVAGFGDVLQVDDRLSLYFGATGRVHGSPHSVEDTYTIGRTWNRLDGFCALTGGTVITRPVILKNGKLHINAEGIINIKIDDPDGYTLTDFEWGGNRMDLAICHPQLHSGVPYKIEFTVKEGALYSFWSGDTCTSRQ